MSSLWATAAKVAINYAQQVRFCPLSPLSLSLPFSSLPFTITPLSLYLGPIKPAKLFNMTAVHDSWVRKFHHKCQNWIVSLVDLIHVVFSSLSGTATVCIRCMRIMYIVWLYANFISHRVRAYLGRRAKLQYKSDSNYIFYMPEKCQTSSDRHNIFSYILHFTVPISRASIRDRELCETVEERSLDSYWFIEMRSDIFLNVRIICWVDIYEH